MREECSNLKLVFKFVSDNLDKKTKVRDYRSNHNGKMVCHGSWDRL